ncbi:hypothetical protein A3782_26635 [Bacillus sp. GZT]|nr:hypothetical protein A3782_26635 [Bacillus sp. GZT]
MKKLCFDFKKPLGLPEGLFRQKDKNKTMLSKKYNQPPIWTAYLHNDRYRKFYFSKLIATTIHPTINNSFLNMYFYLYLGYAIVFSLKMFP